MKHVLFATRIITDFTITIAAPVILLTLIGKWIDGAFHTTPYFYVGGFVIAGLLTAVLITKKARVYGKEWEKNFH